MYSVCILINKSMYPYSYPSAQDLWTGCKRWLSAIRGAPENDDRVISELHSEAVIEQVWTCTWRPWSCELRGHNRATLEIHLEAVTSSPGHWDLGWRWILVLGAIRVSWGGLVIWRLRLHRSRLVYRLAACCRVCFVQGLNGCYVRNPISQCRIGIGLTSEPDSAEWLLIVRRFGAVVSYLRWQIRYHFPSSPIVTMYHPAFPIELDIKGGRLLFLWLRVEWLLAFNWFAVIAEVIAGFLLRGARLAVFGRRKAFVVSCAMASALPVRLSAFIDFLSYPRHWWLVGTAASTGLIGLARFSIASVVGSIGITGSVFRRSGDRWFKITFLITSYLWLRC